MSTKFQGVKRKLKNTNKTKKLVSIDDASSLGTTEYDDYDDDSSIVSNTSIGSIHDHVDMIVSSQTKALSSKIQLTSSDILKQIEDGVPNHLLGFDDEYIRVNTADGNGIRNDNDNKNDNNKHNDDDIHELMKQPAIFKSLDAPEVHDSNGHDESKWNSVIKDRMKAIDLSTILGLANNQKTSNLAEVTQTLMKVNKNSQKINKNVEEESAESKQSLRENWIKKMEEEGLKKAKAEAELIRIKLEAEYKEKERIEQERLEKLRIEQERLDKERDEQEAALKAKIEAYENERQNIIRLERQRIEKEQEEKERQLEEERKRIIQEREEKERIFEEQRLAREKKLEEDRLAIEKELENARIERELKFKEESMKREKEIEDERIERERKFEERRLAMEKQLEEQRLLQQAKEEEERLRREKELEERLEREKRLQKQLEDERAERERKFEESRLAMERQLIEQKLLQDKTEDERRIKREKEQEEILEKERLLAKDLEDKQRETEQRLQEMKFEMDKKFEDERLAREKDLNDKLAREKQLEEKRVKDEMNLESLRMKKAKEEAERIDRERLEHQQRLQEIESMAKQEAKVHINKLTSLLSAEKSLLEYEIQKGKDDENLTKEKKTKELKRVKVEEYSKALADEQRKLVAQLQQQSENNDAFQLQIESNYSKSNSSNNDNITGVVNTTSFDDFKIFNTQPPDPLVILNKIEINDLNMAFTPELNKGMSSSLISPNKVERSDAMIFTPEKAITSSILTAAATSSNKSKKGKQVEADIKRMKSSSLDDEIATVASFLSNGDRIKDTRSTKEKQLDVDIALKKAALQQKIALQELAEARLEVNIAVMRSQKKLIEKIAKDVFDEKSAKSKPRQFMKASAILSETIKNNRKKTNTVKNTPAKKKASSRRPSYDSLASYNSDANSDVISMSSSQFNDNNSIVSDEGSGFFLTGGDDDDNSSLMSLESVGSLESIDESLIDNFEHKTPKKYKMKVIGKYSSHKSAEVAMQMVTHSFDNRSAIDDTLKHGRQKFDLNGDIFDSILQSKKKKSPMKPKYRSASIRFDLDEQLWFVETPVYKKKKKVDGNSINNTDNNSISNTNNNNTKDRSRSLNVKNNNDKDRSRSSSLTSIRSNDKKIRSKNTYTTKKTKATDRKFNADNLPDIDSGIQNINKAGMDDVPENPKTKKALGKKYQQPPSKSKVTSPPINRLNALTFPKILAIHQSASTSSDKNITKEYK